MILDSTTVAFLGVFIGVLLRTLLPYIRKLKEAKETNTQLLFDVKYAYTAIVSLFITCVVTLLVFPAFTIPDVALLYLFCSAFAWGWATNDLVNELIA